MTLIQRLLTALAAVSLLLAFSTAYSFEDDRDYSGSKAKSQIKSLHKKLQKLEDGLEDERKLAKPAWFEKQIVTIRKQIDKIPKKDPDWDISIESAFVDYIESQAGPATRAYADKSYREKFDKAISGINAGLAEDKRLARPNWFDGEYKKVERFFSQIDKKEPERDTSAERAEFENLQQSVNAAIAAYDQRVVEESEPALVAVDPLPGVDVAKALYPQWCDGYEPDGRNYSTKFSDLASQLDLRSIRVAAVKSCEQPEFDKRQAWAAAWRQGVINRTGISDMQVQELYRFALKSDEERESLIEEACASYTGSSIRSAGAAGLGTQVENPRQIASRKALSHALGCDSWPLQTQSGDIYVSDLIWWMDQGVEPGSELVRSVFVLSQIGTTISEHDRADGRSFADLAGDKIGGFAFSISDAKRLNADRFEQQLRAIDTNEYSQLMAKITFARARHEAAQFEQVYSSISPELKELVIDVPTGAFAQWETQASRYRSAIANLHALEQHYLNARPADQKGHFETAFGFFRDFVQAEIAEHKPADFEALRDIVFGPVGYPLAVGVLVAAAWDEQHLYAARLYQQMDNRRVWRGPRWAAYWATLERFTEMKAANPNMAIEQNQIARWLTEPNPNWAYKAYELTFNNAGGQSATALAKEVDKRDDNVNITYVTEQWEQPVYDCVETNKIDRITSDGKVHYKRNCTYKGKETRSSTEQPMSIASLLAESIAPGNLVESFVEFTNVRRAVPEVVWLNEDKQSITNFMGIALNWTAAAITNAAIND